jgi:uncharacterized membrane protein
MIVLVVSVYLVFCVLMYARQRAMLFNANLVLNNNISIFMAIIDVLLSVFAFIAYTIYYFKNEKNKIFLKF